MRLAQFQEGSASEFENAIAQLRKKVGGELSGLVIDLRNNPGGLLTEAIRVSDIFLKDGIIVYTDGRLDSQKSKYFAHDDGDEPQFPIVMLVNGGSASASEIMSGAFQDHKRAIVLGTQTFGKGSVQTVLPVDNGGAIRLTTALYYTMKGRSIQAQGIKPDIEVEQDEELIETKIVRKRKFDPIITERNLRHVIKNAKGEKEVKVEEPKPGTIGAIKTAEEETNKPDLSPGSRAALEAKIGDLLKADRQLSEGLKILKSWDKFKDMTELRVEDLTAKKDEPKS